MIFVGDWKICWNRANMLSPISLLINARALAHSICANS